MSANEFIPVFFFDLLQHEPATLWLKDAKIGTSLPEIKFMADTRQGVQDQMNKMLDSLIEEALANYSDPICYVVHRGGIKKHTIKHKELYYGIYCAMITSRELACPTLPGGYVLSDSSNGNLEYEHRDYPLILRPTLRPIPKKTKVGSGLRLVPVKEECEMSQRLRNIRIYYIPFEKGIRYELDGKYLPPFSLVKKASKFNSTLLDFINASCLQNDLNVAYVCHRNPMTHTYLDDELIGSFALVLRSEDNLLTTLPGGYRLQSNGAYVNDADDWIYPTYYTFKEDEVKSMESFTDYKLTYDKLRSKEVVKESPPEQVHRNPYFEIFLNGMSRQGVFAFDKQNECIELQSYLLEDFEAVRTIEIRLYDCYGKSWTKPLMFMVTPVKSSLSFKTDASVTTPELATVFKYTYTLN